MIAALEHRLYLAGYRGWTMPRALRRLIARTGPHRAWFSGWRGCFEEDGILYGPSNPYPGAVEADRSAIIGRTASRAGP